MSNWIKSNYHLNYPVNLDRVYSINISSSFVVSNIKAIINFNIYKNENLVWSYPSYEEAEIEYKKLLDKLELLE